MSILKLNRIISWKTKCFRYLKRPCESVNKLINEIIKSNGIEGVHTTKKDVYDSMNSNKKYRFSGIVKKYKQITESY